jgi:ketosteroid isomerase-like protein
MDTRQLVETYHNAWTTGDITRARGYLADDLDFRGSIDTFNKADDFVAALRQFQGMLRGVTVLQSFFDETGAALLYDCNTATPAGVIRTAEFFAVRNGKIAEIRLVFDATELRKLMGG